MSCNVQFSTNGLARELRGILKVSKPFLTDLGQRAIQDAADGLGSLSAGTPERWGVRKVQPIQTRVSKGKFEVGAAGGQDVFAEISFEWEVLLVPAAKRKKPSTALQLDGMISTEVRLFPGEPGYSAADPGSEVAIWHFDVGMIATPGTKRSPGCHFHTQLPWRALGRVGWDLPVPRLPSLFVSPVDVLDFVLGELFQEDWKSACVEARAAAGEWTVGQRKRLHAILDWHRENVSAQSSFPWLGLKAAQPSSPILMD